MQIVDAAKSRYSTKAFDSSKKLTDEQVTAVKELIRHSASSVNSQPWHFIIAGTEEGKARVSKGTQDGFAFNDTKVKNASHVVVFCAKTSIDDDYLTALADLEDQAGRYPSEEVKNTVNAGRKFFVGLHRETLNDAEHWMQKQVYLNVGTLLLGAKTLGLDAVPIEGFDAEKLDAEFGLKEQGLTSVVIVALGHRSEDDFNAKLPKARWAEEQVFTEC
ncbi:oxygen-insensitive NAD(P)H nitroreductase [Vibrio agarivorans]|uniref:oxygen-insensitive NAD(P)H nitroreductase n=1 Tax=Vibrio agarivorans TaxID=153622 RepID=UPI00222EA7E0|nr:oxygen-insensitive NAD(P)H nitroreductase [Vibrio agarivorans]MDN3659912.1 oxygen-insensitive NAD(P)H nitroreductase [Vibrio agarivorans]